MFGRVYFLATFLMSLLLGIHCTPSQEELEAIEILNVTNENFNENIKGLISLVLETRKIQDYPINQKKTEILLGSFPDISRLKTLPYQSFENETIKRQVQVLQRIGLLALEKDAYRNATSIIEKLRSFQYDKGVCLRNKQTNKTDECSALNFQFLMDLSYESNDADDMKFYWKAGRKVSDAVTTIVYLKRFAEYYRDAAKINQYENASQMWYENYEDDSLLGQLEEVMRELQPLYKQLHAFIRSKLVARYPKLIFEDSLIPQHLLNQVQFRSEVLDLESDYLPYSEQNPSYFDELLLLKNNSFKKNLNAADDFLQSMDMIAMTQKFFSSHSIVKISKKWGRQCTSELFDLDAHVISRYCAKTDFKNFLNMHGAMTLVQYSLHKGPLPVGLNMESCPGFGKGIAEASALAAMNLEYLQKIGIPKDYKYHEEIRLNMLMYMALDTLLPIAEHFVQESLWIGILEGSIKPSEYNCFYWSLMQKYAGVEPPEHRTDVHFDVNTPFYDAFEERPVAKIFAKLFGHHLYTTLCQLEEKPLEQCNWFGNKNIGKKLREIMSLGSKKSWGDIFKMLFGHSNLTASGILKYFEPLHTWLVEKNKKNGANVGWSELLKCDTVSSFYDEDVFLYGVMN